MLNHNQNICVYLRGGTYRLTSKLSLTAADSGGVNHQIIYQAYPGETPVVSGGQELTGWVPDGGDRYKVTLTAQQVEDLCDPNPQTPAARCFRQLYVNGDRATRARWPNLGKLMPAGPSEPAPRSYSRIVGWVPGTPGAISLNSADSPSAPPSGWTGLEMVVQMYWASNVIRVASAAQCGNLTCVTPEGHEEFALFHSTPPWEYPAQDPAQPYHFENLLSLLDAPGEWFVERPAENYPAGPRVYYKPRVGETIGFGTVLVAPRVETLIELTGDSGCSSFQELCVQNLIFTGITFEHTTWRGPNQYGYLEHPYMSQWWGATPLDRVPAAIYIENASNIQIKRNVLRHLGGAGIDARRNVWDVGIVGNVLQDVADAGITLGPLGEGSYSIPDGIDVANNHVSYTGQDYRGGVGILVGNAQNTLVEHNEISHTPYTGMNVGWGLQGAVPYSGNVIRQNHIHNILELLIDGGGVYVQGPGVDGDETIIRENYIHDILRSRMSYPLGGCPPGVSNSPAIGIYVDQAGKQVDVGRNVLLDTQTCSANCLVDDPPAGCSGGVAVDHGGLFFHCCADITDVPSDNGGQHGAVKAAAGLEPAYKAIAPASTTGSFVTRFSLGTPRNDHQGRVGFKMTVGSRDLTVRKIGRFKAPGNIGTHMLRIAQVGLPYQECRATLDTKTAPRDALGFQYASLATPCRLIATQQYRVTSDEISGGDYWYDYDNRMRTESDGVITGGTYRDGQGVDHDLTDPSRGYVPVNIVYDGQKLLTAVTTEGTVRTDSAQAGIKIAVGSNDLYVWRLGRYFLEGNAQSHALGLYGYSGGSPLASANVAMGSADSVDELGFKWATLPSATRLRRSTSYYFSSLEEQGLEAWLDLDTEVQPASASQVNPAYFAGIWNDVPNSPGKSYSYGPVNAVYEPLNRALPCQPSCGTVFSPLLCYQDGYRAGMRITVPAGKTLTVIEIGREYFNCNGTSCPGYTFTPCTTPTQSNTHTLAVYDAINGALKASATLNIGSAPEDDDHFKYAKLPAPLVLTPGDYYVSDETSSTDALGSYTTIVVPGSDVTNVRPVYYSGSNWTTVETPNYSYGPMNLIYYVTPLP